VSSEARKASFVLSRMVRIARMPRMFQKEIRGIRDTWCPILGIRALIRDEIFKGILERKMSWTDKAF
jgi:hypothetical protein